MIMEKIHFNKYIAIIRPIVDVVVRSVGKLLTSKLYQTLLFMIIPIVVVIRTIGKLLAWKLYQSQEGKEHDNEFSGLLFLERMLENC